MINWLNLKIRRAFPAVVVKKKPRIMITGPQGSGKTTQARILAEKLGVPMVGAGELARKFANSGHKDSQKVSAAIAEGQLIDDGIMGDLVKKEIAQQSYEKGFVTDGYPRAMSQLKIFNPSYDQVFYLKLSDQEAKKRLLQRGRADDTPEAIKERLEWYHYETSQLLDYYSKRGKLVIIDGDQSIEGVAKEIAAKLIFKHDD